MQKLANQTARHQAARFASKKGFSLVELLCVLAIVSLLASASWPAVMGVIAGDRLSNNAYQLSALIQQARTTAVSQHTYVWLGFNTRVSNGASTVTVASVIGQSSLASDLQSNKVVLASRPTVLRNVNLATASNYAGLPGLDSANNTDAGSQTSTFSATIPGASNATFSSVIAFSPDGQVYLPQTSGGALQLYPCVGVGLSASPAPVSSLRTAAVQVHGLSGQVSVFQQ